MEILFVSCIKEQSGELKKKGINGKIRHHIEDNG